VWIFLQFHFLLCSVILVLSGFLISPVKIYFFPHSHGILYMQSMRVCFVACS
jgi:hypothetical protein